MLTINMVRLGRQNVTSEKFRQFRQFRPIVTQSLFLILLSRVLATMNLREYNNIQPSNTAEEIL